MITGEDHGLLLGQMTSLSSIQCTSVDTTLFKAWGIRLSGCRIGGPVVGMECSTTEVCPVGIGFSENTWEKLVNNWVSSVRSSVFQVR